MTGKARRPPRAPVAPVEESALPKGERIILRILVEADAAAFIAAAARSRALHRPWVHPPASAAEFARRIERARDDSSDDCGFVREGFSARYLKIGGRWRDHERWAINADQWRARRPAKK